MSKVIKLSTADLTRIELLKSFGDNTELTEGELVSVALDFTVKAIRSSIEAEPETELTKDTFKDILFLRKFDELMPSNQQ